MGRKNAGRVRGMLVVVAGLLAAQSTTVRGADHEDSPRTLINQVLDILDVFVFRSPTNRNNTVIIVTHSTDAGVVGPVTFQPGANYDLKVDNNGDAVED